MVMYHVSKGIVESNGYICGYMYGHEMCYKYGYMSQTKKAEN